MDLRYGNQRPTWTDYCTDYDTQRLFTAVAANDVTSVARQLELGTDVNRKNSQGFTPLIIAAINCHTEMVNCLLAHGADVEMKNRHDMTALHCAAFFGKLDIVIALIEAGAALNVKQDQGYTAVLLAAIGGHELVMKKLLESNAVLDMNETASQDIFINSLQNLYMGVYFQFLRRSSPINIIYHVIRLVACVVVMVCFSIFKFFTRLLR